MDDQLINFSPGPTKIPNEVLKRAQEELISFNSCGISVLEMSHRSAEFMKICNDAEIKLRQLADIPENYKVLFLQGGASAQFSAIPLNLIDRKSKRSADYIVTGSWSAHAVAEAAKYGTVREVFPRLKSFIDIPSIDQWSFDPEASFIYYCGNETVHGVEFHDVIEHVSDVPIVCDLSSSILSRELPISKFGLIFASAQKNLGCAGVTIVIVRDDLLTYAVPNTPAVLNYKMQSGMNSLYNTPPTFAIYMAGLMIDWSIGQGGLSKIGEINDMKSSLLYACIDGSDGFYKCHVKPQYRSRVNVVFRVKDGDEKLENSLVAFAKSKYNIIEIKGHRSVGGFRASLYNSIPLEFVEILIRCMNEFKYQCESK